MKCEYCGSEDQTGKQCGSCGAKLPEKKDVWKSAPFFYNGYICYCLSDGMIEQTREVQFWLGRELIERIVIPRYVLEENVKLGEDPMSFFWDLFLLAHGEKEVMEWQEKNSKYPATFQITRIENKEKSTWLSFSMEELAKASKR